MDSLNVADLLRAAEEQVAGYRQNYESRLRDTGADHPITKSIRVCIESAEKSRDIWRLRAETDGAGDSN